MEQIKIENPEALDKAVEILKSGGVVMYPTETCYGLAVDISNQDALRKLYALKGRDADKPLSILVGNLEMAGEYGVFSEKALELAGKYWPGPLSIVVPRTKKLPVFFNSNEKFVAIRFSSDEFCQKLPLLFGKPVTTTSANPSGESPLYSPENITLNVDLLIDGGVLIENLPSTIVKVEGEKLTILRKGGIDAEL